MAGRITVVLPIDAEAPRELAAAPGLDTFAGRCIGVVDNGLWRSMDVLVRCLGEVTRKQRAAGIAITPFDHLAPDFGEQQEALAPFATRVAGAVAGLGN
jgi:hypothetical protein